MTGDPDPPAHVLPRADAKYALCGATDYPRILWRFVQAHIDGYGMVVCPDCAPLYRRLVS